MKFQQLSKRQRRYTPLPFALYLLAGVWKRHSADRVAVLWVDRRTNYTRLWPWVELYGIVKDACTYAGPWPVICHPPCGPWGKFRHVSQESRHHGVKAIELVHRWGGVVEHPLGSSLFRVHGDGRQVERVNQGDFGHYVPKATLLYWV